MRIILINPHTTPSLSVVKHITMISLHKIILIMGILSFLGCGGQESDKSKKHEILSEDLKTKYRVALNSDGCTTNFPFG